jgi:hypothetical protein
VQAQGLTSLRRARGGGRAARPLLPPAVTKGGDDGATSSIVEQVVERNLSEIADISDESRADRMRLVITIKRDASTGAVLDDLFEFTRLQRDVDPDMVALVDGAACRVSLREALAHFVDHQRRALARGAPGQSEQRVLATIKNDLRDVGCGDLRRTSIR